MLRLDAQTYEQLVKFRGELERRTGKPRTLSQTFSVMAEASALSFGVLDFDLSNTKTSQAHEESRRAFHKLVRYAGTASLKNDVEAVFTSKMGVQRK